MTRRVFARANVAGLTHSEWGDVPDGISVSDLLLAGLVTLVDYDGNGPPAELPRRRCCL